MARLALSVSGTVQGVGFRPFVYREARARLLTGYVQNQRGSVHIEVQGPEPELAAFLIALRRDLRPPATIEDLLQQAMSERDGEREFEIRPSAALHGSAAALPADLAPCAECLAEIRSPAARRHRYAFTNCTRCGPRYSIVRALPYDRERTTLAEFTLCQACAREYAAVDDRRYHAEPIACPRCGPELSLVSAGDKVRARGSAALEQSVELLRAGGIVALKAAGGFQLLCDASSESAVRELRRRKRRDARPFAVLFRDLAAARQACDLSPSAAALLQSPAAPIVLAPRNARAALASNVGPGTPFVGALLPATPLHVLLMDACAVPLVCTSGNLQQEPLCVDNDEALTRLAGVADAFLLHDRAIARPLDDSVARCTVRGPMIQRRARGYAPLAVARFEHSGDVLALGAHFKSSVALLHGGQLILGQHLGDLSSPRGCDVLEDCARDLLRFFDAQPARVACDLHPDYASTRLAERVAAERGVPIVRVQHHLAHIAAVIAEHGLKGDVFGLAWDGVGLGTDGSAWGGESLLVSRRGWKRLGSLRPFPLPGGDAAAREPRRAALGLLYELDPLLAARWAGRWFTAAETDVLLGMLARSVNCPLTSSLGRLFDAVAALLGLTPRCSFEAQAALELEALAGACRAAPYPIAIRDAAGHQLDFEPALRAILDDLARARDPEQIAASFIETLVSAATELAGRAGVPQVALAGGCFQNARLLDSLLERLDARGFRSYVGQGIPVNDGGIAAGQAWVAANPIGGA